MKMFFYWKLAATGIVKNRKIYFPYILSCIGMIMMEYIIQMMLLVKQKHNYKL